MRLSSITNRLAQHRVTGVVFDLLRLASCYRPIIGDVRRLFRSARAHASHGATERVRTMPASRSPKGSVRSDRGNIFRRRPVHARPPCAAQTTVPGALNRGLRFKRGAGCDACPAWRHTTAPDRSALPGAPIDSALLALAEGPEGWNNRVRGRLGPERRWRPPVKGGKESLDMLRLRTLVSLPSWLPKLFWRQASNQCLPNQHSVAAVPATYSQEL